MTDQLAHAPTRRTTTGLAGGRVSEIVIVQALDTPHEVATGQILHGYIEHLLSQNPVGLRLRFVEIEHAAQFVAFVSELAADAARGRIPLLHVECHGDEEHGLQFANGSMLSWDELGRALEPLNRASRFNLITLFSACYGAHSVGQVEGVEPAPFWFMAAPTAVVDPGELMAGMRAFYRTLIETLDLGQAANALTACKLTHGAWYPVPAQQWYLRIVSGYLETHCTEDATMKRIAGLKLQGHAVGKDVGPGRLRRVLRAQNRTSFTGRYFDIFFMVNDLPENATRFQAVKVEVEASILALKKGGRHVL